MVKKLDHRVKSNLHTIQAMYVKFAICLETSSIHNWQQNMQSQSNISTVTNWINKSSLVLQGKMTCFSKHISLDKDKESFLI